MTPWPSGGSKKFFQFYGKVNKSCIPQRTDTYIHSKKGIANHNLVVHPGTIPDDRVSLRPVGSNGSSDVRHPSSGLIEQLYDVDQATYLVGHKSNDVQRSLDITRVVGPVRRTPLPRVVKPVLRVRRAV